MKRLVVAVAAALVLAGCASAPSEGYWSQFRCEGDCGDDSDCPWCSAHPVDEDGCPISLPEDVGWDCDDAG